MADTKLTPVEMGGGGRGGEEAEAMAPEKTAVVDEIVNNALGAGALFVPNVLPCLLKEKVGWPVSTL